MQRTLPADDGLGNALAEPNNCRRGGYEQLCEYRQECPRRSLRGTLESILESAISGLSKFLFFCPSHNRIVEGRLLGFVAHRASAIYFFVTVLCYWHISTSEFFAAPAGLPGLCIGGLFWNGSVSQVRGILHARSPSQRDHSFRFRDSLPSPSFRHRYCFLRCLPLAWLSQASVSPVYCYPWPRSPP